MLETLGLSHGVARGSDVVSPSGPKNSRRMLLSTPWTVQPCAIQGRDHLGADQPVRAGDEGRTPLHRGRSTRYTVCLARVHQTTGRIARQGRTASGCWGIEFFVAHGRKRHDDLRCVQRCKFGGVSAIAREVARARIDLLLNLPADLSHRARCLSAPRSLERRVRPHPRTVRHQVPCLDGLVRTSGEPTEGMRP